MIQNKRTGRGAMTNIQTANGRVVTKPTIQTVVATATGPSRFGTSKGTVDNTTGLISKNYTLDNSSGTSDKVFMIGDAYGAAAAGKGGTIADPTSTPYSTVAIDKLRYATRPMQANVIQFKSSVSSAQFAKKVEYAIAHDSGGFETEPIPLSPFESAADNNPLVRSVNVANFRLPVVLGDNSGILVTVAAGEKVIVDIEPLSRVTR